MVGVSGESYALTGVSPAIASLAPENAPWKRANGALARVWPVNGRFQRGVARVDWHLLARLEIQNVDKTFNKLKEAENAFS